MRAIKLKTHVSSEHTVQLQLPDDIGEGPAEVIVLVDEAPTPARESAGTLSDFLASSTIVPELERSKEEIDAYLRAERDSWE